MWPGSQRDSLVLISLLRNEMRFGRIHRSMDSSAICFSRRWYFYNLHTGATEVTCSMPEALTSRERLLAGASPSQEFKKSHMHKPVNRIRFVLHLWLSTKFTYASLSGQVLKIFIIVLHPPVESHLSNLDTAPPALSTTGSLLNKKAAAREEKKKKEVEEKKPPKKTSTYLLPNAVAHLYWRHFLMSDMLLC